MNKLERILETAKTTSKFYQQEMKNWNTPEEFYKNFILHKSDVIDRVYDIISAKYEGNLYKSMQVNTTSGTSGVPVRIMWEPSELSKSNLSIWRLRKKYHGISPSDCYCELHTITYYGSRINRMERVIIRDNQISFCKLIQDDAAMAEYYDTMVKYRPKWLLFQPSFALNFIDFCKRKQLPAVSSIQYVELCGELLTKSAKEQIQDFFFCSAANMYGCMEVNSIAYECPCGTMHVLEDNVAIEVDEEQNVYLTSLRNEAFPLIKYDVGDKAEIEKNYRCSCGKTGTVIHSIIGRTSRQIILENGEIINESVVAYCVERAESVVGIGLKQYRAVYKDGILNVEIMSDAVNDKWKQTFAAETKRQFLTLCHYDKIEIMFVDKLNDTDSAAFRGKHAMLEVTE